jgi:hypothetical protein
VPKQGEDNISLRLQATRDDGSAIYLGGKFNEKAEMVSSHSEIYFLDRSFKVIEKAQN